MNAIHCSAPGKLFLGGEYAVLHGAQAVVTAVDRRAVAMPVRRAGRPSPVLRAVFDHVTCFLEARGSEPVKLEPIKVRSPDFQIGRKKIGLGSSAAVCASACGTLFELAGLEIAAHRHQVLDIAQAAHRAAQGGRGSGADVAASVLGGTLIFNTSGKIQQINVDGIQIVVVWSGRAASTKRLIEKVEVFSKTDPLGHGACFDELNQLASELAQAYGGGDPLEIIAATGRYGESMGRLGSACGAPIVTPEHELMANIAADLGGAAKPSGAGGGDVAVAVFEDADSTKKFRNRCVRHNLVPLDLVLGAPGLRLD